MTTDKMKEIDCTDLAPPEPARALDWGVLPQHYSVCPNIEEDGHNDWCTDCEGGRIFWGSYYWQDVGQCHGCNKEEVRVAEFDNGWWLCLDCYMLDHKNECGCALWLEHNLDGSQWEEK